VAVTSTETQADHKPDNEQDDRRPGGDQDRGRALGRVDPWLAVPRNERIRRRRRRLCRGGHIRLALV
jgi:hypothetical protein